MQKREGRSFATPPTSPILPDLGRTGRKGQARLVLPPPTVLPPISAALSRRAALFGAATVAGVTAAALPAVSLATGLSANDARLIAIADAYEALDREVEATHSRAPGWDALIARYTDLEIEAAETPADSLAGLAAKARLCQSPTARGCADFEHILSAVDDLHRLLGSGALA